MTEGKHAKVSLFIQLTKKINHKKSQLLKTGKIYSHLLFGEKRETGIGRIRRCYHGGIITAGKPAGAFAHISIGRDRTIWQTVFNHALRSCYVSTLTHLLHFARLQPTRLLRPWDFPGKSTGVGCHRLLPHTQRTFLNSAMQD